jgi:transposase
MAWAIVDRPWRGAAPPAVVYSYAPGRSGEHAVTLLQGYTGVLQTDGYAAYRSLADPKRAGGPATLAFCWAHWRRQWFDIAKSPPTPTATEALKRIAALYEIEGEIRGKSADERRAVRQQRTKPLAETLRAWLEKTLAQVAGGSSNYTKPAIGSMRLGSLFLTLPTRALTGQQIVSSEG